MSRTRIQIAREMLQDMIAGKRRLPFPLAGMDEALNVQRALESYGFAATINKDVMEWYTARGFYTVDYEIGYRIFPNRATYEKQ